MKTRLLTTLVVLALASGLLNGCANDDTNEWNRVVCEAELVNGGAPIVAAYIDVGGDGLVGGTDDSYPIDWAPIVFRARPYTLSTMTMPEDDVYSWFHITHYDLIWRPGENAPASLTDYNVTHGGFDLIVPVGEDAVSAVMIADRRLKEDLTAGLVGNPLADFNATAELHFYGHESGSQHEVTVPASVFVYFTGAITTE